MHAREGVKHHFPAALGLALAVWGCAPPASFEAPFQRAAELRQAGEAREAVLAYDLALREGISAGGFRLPKQRFQEARAFAELAALDAYGVLASAPPEVRTRAPFVERLRSEGVDLRRRACARLLALKGEAVAGTYRHLEPAHDVERHFLLLALMMSADDPLLPADGPAVPVAFRTRAEDLVRAEFARDIAFTGLRKAEAYALGVDARRGAAAAAARRWGDALDRFGALEGFRPELRDRLAVESRSARLAALDLESGRSAEVPFDPALCVLSAPEHVLAATASAGEAVAELARRGRPERARERFWDALRHAGFVIATSETPDADRARLRETGLWLNHVWRLSREE